MISMKKRNNLDTAGFWLQPMAVLQGTAVALALLLFSSLGLALAVCFLPWQAAPNLLNLLAHLAVFAGAAWSGKKCLKKAWIHGIAVGLASFVLLGFLGSADIALLTWLWWQKLLRMLFVAMLGGMMGGLLKRG